MTTTFAASPRGRLGLPLSLAACLTIAACGSSAPRPAHASVADGCVRQANGDPAEMSLCLASHRIVVKASVRTCVRGVRDKDQLIECLRKAAQ